MLHTGGSYGFACIDFLHLLQFSAAANFTTSFLGFGGGGGGSFFSDCEFADTMTKTNDAARANTFFIKQFFK